MEQFLQSNEFIITLVSVAIAGGFYAFRKQIISASKVAGKAAGLFLKRFGLNDEAEQVGQAFIDGMKETESTPVDKEKLSKMIDETYPAPQIDKQQE